ncbi:helix-turn-helix transcriptional regulator [Methylorubrum rhodesianum]|jgi:phage repressor protein C with HTH and peptisase S24 domain|uniref:Helix-turn-helix transcriptional regulator n=1 Tax=Methylorubrum rhodesianum TaxID=29427 RepID=A0ABU9ZB20_9HYPH|nr:MULTISPECIES: helix-turn-helix transcriptional regulator [Methylorubrum]MBY0142088.1 helix-turn-helix transcriptional regulator [Methylorubrum populi]MRI56667.1 helix-turn-helix transcriptional regulator [Methylobacterium sp. DB1607]MBB5764925.1 phage repressor protein C with HTH and peptisase S24 domain [Methylorubrum rhodesianum]MBI1690858.1 helix-turn-helix transcriptional regulator [Methylorubrum sp. DB1722]MBK3401454.1 helix-turn-helix transcriptional regulator [Methylorubrum rhodesian
MLSHEQIWTAIDRLAERHGFSASGLARRAGLDATSFNRSKRIGPDGRKRWPSTESIAKVLAATGASLDDFLHLVDSGQPQVRTMVPLIGLTQAGSGRLFTEEGIPTGGPGWDEIEFPDLGDDRAFALEVQGDSMLPLYRDGDVLIVAPNAGIRKGDRIVARLTNGEVVAKELRRRTARTIELASLNPEHEDRMVPLAEVAWMARVMWVRQ